MSQCPICEHAKIEAINAALDQKRLPAVVSRQFRLKLEALAAHIVHRSAPGKTSTIVSVVEHLKTQVRVLPSQVSTNMDDTLFVEPVPETPDAVLKLGLPYVRRAVQLAGADRLAQERIVATLNRALEDEQMGLS
jgi:hypothetical protein